LKVQSVELKVQSIELKVQSVELKVQSVELKVQSVELKVQSAELKVRSHHPAGGLKFYFELRFPESDRVSRQSRDVSRSRGDRQARIV
jgi:hypothetical protein